ncbi:ABC transporter substrate-binding protein [Paenibacillus sambharensis]|uniref:ABC transporter substrate-binding protein n=1 Tax=Paenibacillus sambharensis TaxID=1803190 RepID=A0A2W1LR88_9BACL|nr:extracellular solute-binding protein [Paenibacillus sambharensis]PZD97044.1 ABC transporter substrate-binding protein [Paenibacillus sambharensis]
MRKQLKKGIIVLAASALAFGLAGCSKETSGSTIDGNSLSLEEITTKAKEEGQVVSVGMPDSWANWVETWADLKAEYGLNHTDTDMSSAEEIAKFDAEKDKPTADIGDIGIAFGPVAVEKGVTQPYKTTYWEEIPDWAKDEEGHWVLGYQGTIAIMTNKDLVEKPPASFEDIKNGDYKVTIGDVTKAAQSQMAVLATAYALGGDETNLEPALAFYEELAKQGRISMAELTVANIEKGEISVAMLWDFNALGYRQSLDPDKFDVAIPKEGSVVSGYATIINKYAPHPHAAMLTREFILSDEGQINLAKGFARPIRESVELPEDVKSKLIDPAQYEQARPVEDYKAWEEMSQKLPQLWQERVLVHIN